MRDDKTLFLFVFRDEYLTAAPGTATQVGPAAKRFAGVGLGMAADLRDGGTHERSYFDTVSQIRMDRWTQDATALVGDAAACVSLMAGEGTGLAIAEAYVLAGELQAGGGDFARGLRALRAAVDALSEKEAGVGGEIRFVVRPQTPWIAFRNVVTQTDASAVHRGTVHRPRLATTSSCRTTDLDSCDHARTAGV